MPPVSKAIQKGTQARVMIFGQPGTRKTWWAARAAEFGFNVILADMDGKFQILKMLTPEAQARIYHLDLRPTGDYSMSGAAVLAMAAQGGALYLDEDSREFTLQSKIQPDHNYAKLHLSKAQPDTVLIIDSWSAFCQNIAALNVPLVNATKVSKLEWDDFQKVRLAGDAFLNNLKRLNCHVIVTGHAETYARKKADHDPKAQLRDQIDAVRVQPASITRAHGETLARQFNDMLFFEVPSAMQGTYISTAGSEDFDALTQTVAPGRYKWDQLLFDKFMSTDQLAAVADNQAFSSEALTPLTGAEILAAKASTSASAATVEVGAKSVLLNLGKK